MFIISLLITYFQNFEKQFQSDNNTSTNYQNTYEYTMSAQTICLLIKTHENYCKTKLKHQPISTSFDTETSKALAILIKVSRRGFVLPFSIICN